ncbi:MAG: GntR family transcriptional regulator [Synergistaceae bacterium]|nr:GntR family transcriptional regulator [Synergistaceae bacterium]
MRADSKKESVIDALVKIAGEENYKAGNRFPPERELAKRLGVSRNVLREAMISLEAMGVIEKKERQGVFVKSQNTDKLVHNLQQMQLPPVEFMRMQMEVRMMICVPAVEAAAIRRTKSDLEKLWNCFEEFSRLAGSEESEEAGAKWESLLHHLETEAAHNALLSRINESIASMIERNNAFVHSQLVLKDNSWFEHIRHQHETIIRALESHDPCLAGRTLGEHIIESYDAMKKNYPQYSLDGYQIYWEIIKKQS